MTHKKVLACNVAAIGAAGSLFGVLFHLQEPWAVGIKLLCIFALIHHALTSPHSAKHHLLIGWLWGASSTLTGMSWLYTAMHDVGGMPQWLALLAMLLFSLLLGVFNGIALIAYAKTASRSSPFQQSLILIASWILAEWLRTWVLTGLPWMSIGYGFIDTPFSGLASMVGVLGVGGAVIALLVCIHLLFKKLPSPQRRNRAMVTGLAITLIAGAWLSQYWRFTSSHGAPLHVALLQGNVPQTIKFDPSLMQHHIAQYATLAALAAQSNTQRAPHLIVFPETALPTTTDRIDPKTLQTLTTAAAKTTLLVGHIGEVNQAYTNRLSTWASANSWAYDKVHLVPFGEAIPTGFQWFVNMLNMPLSSLARGSDEQMNLTVAGTAIAANICYEELFAHEWRTRGASAHVLLNASNFGWYGNSNVFAQHTNIARMRALEFQKPYLSATNNGTTLAVLPTGQAHTQLAPNTQGTLHVTVQGMAGATPYAYWGDWAMVALCGVILLTCVWRQRSKRCD